MNGTRQSLLMLVANRPPAPKQIDPHAGLAPYERGTVKWIGEVGHWHVTEVNGRRWIKGPVVSCPDVRRARARSVTDVPRDGRR
jgi:hypothetical protein